MPSSFNEEERLEFITDNKILWTNTCNFIPEEKREDVDLCILQFMAKWKKVFNPTEVNPVSAVEKNLEKLKTMYIELKGSVNYESNDTTSKNLVINSIEEGHKKLKFLLSVEKTRKAGLRVIQYQIGHVLKVLKQLTKSKKHFSLLLKDFSFLCI